MYTLRKYRWFALPLLPLLVYLGLIVTAYIRPPLHINGISYTTRGQSMAVVEIENRSRWPVVLRSASVQGVLPPDEVGALTIRGGSLPSISHLLGDRTHVAGSGQLRGWRVEPKQQAIYYGVSLIWYQDADLRWFHCPTFRYSYLGWPMQVRGFCREQLRGAAVDGGKLPDAVTEMASWRPPGKEVAFRTVRAGDDLYIIVAAGAEAGSRELIMNRFTEEPGGGRARFHLRIITLEEEQGRSLVLKVPLRRGEPDPEVLVQLLSWEEYDRLTPRER